MNEHTVSAFDEDLNALSRRIVEMGGLAEAMLGSVADALSRRDVTRANEIIRSDATLDRLQAETEEGALSLIARRQPMAGDLRHVMGTIRIAADIERVGDLIKNVAKRITAMEEAFISAKTLGGIQNMSHLVLTQLKQVLDAFAQNNPALARDVWMRDGEVDALHNSLFRELLTYMMEDPRSITYSTHLLFISKNIERCGDHATNIAETVYFIQSGQYLNGDRPKLDTTALVTRFNPS